MLTEKQVKEIREHLERAQNPLFFFDNDPDGLCSFLLLKRWIGRGKGVAVRSYPDLNSSYARKISELNSDYIFILDKPFVSKEFLESVHELNLPIVWIDHHDLSAGENIKDKVPKYVDYYNPVFNKSKSGEPVTALCYQIVSNVDKSKAKEDLWIAVVGCVSDWYVPEFYDKIKGDYPELYVPAKEAPDVLYGSDLGKIIRMLSFGLKDSTTNVMSMIRFLSEARSPEDVLQENSKNKTLHKKFEQITKKYNKFLEKAKEIGKNSDKVLFFKYGGDSSMSSDLSNELKYIFKDKIIVVAYLKPGEGKANISIRGEKVRDKIVKIIEALEGASGGGHEEAVGARIKIDDLDFFKEQIEKAF